MSHITEPSHSETLQILKKDAIKNLNLINFMENYPTQTFRFGDTIMVRGLNDNHWIYLSSSDRAELSRLIEVVNEKNAKYAAVESWMVPIISAGKKIAWKMSASQFLLPPEITLPAVEIATSPISSRDVSSIYGHLGYKDIASVEYVQERVSRGVSTSIYDGNRIVAWAATHDDGAMGFLYVLPEYRFKGYATAVLVSLIDKVRKRGQMPFGQVEVGNVKSLNLLAKLGFMPHKDVNWLRMY